MAILMDPGMFVLATIIAPEMRLPWLTDGEERVALLYVTVRSTVAMPSMALP